MRTLDGPRSIDDAVLRLVKLPKGVPCNSGSPAAPGAQGAAPDQWTFGGNVAITPYYYLTDAQFSTLAMIATGLKPRLWERVRYTAYGEALQRYGADVDASGTVTSADQAVITGLSGTDIASPAVFATRGPSAAVAACVSQVVSAALLCLDKRGYDRAKRADRCFLGVYATRETRYG